MSNSVEGYITAPEIVHMHTALGQCKSQFQLLIQVCWLSVHSKDTHSSVHCFILGQRPIMRPDVQILGQVLATFDPTFNLNELLLGCD